MRVSVEQGLCGYQYSRRAVPALRCSKVGKSILQRVKLGVFSEAFYRQDVPSIALERQQKAGKHRLAVQKNGSSAAFAGFVAMLRPRMPKNVSHNITQTHGTH